MKQDRAKLVKLAIVVLATLATLAIMGTVLQIIQTVLPFLIVGLGIFAGYRWVLSDEPPPSADEVEQQARGIFSRFRRSKKVVEAAMQVDDILQGSGKPAEQQTRESRPAAKTTQTQPAAKSTKPERLTEQSPQPKATGPVSFADSDVVITADDFIQADLARLEAKEKKLAAKDPEVTNDVLAQIQAREEKLDRY